MQIEELILKSHTDEECMDALLKLFKPKVIAISREYFLVGADFDDLLQEGMIGLYKAIREYDKDKNHNFSSFASLCIHRQLQNAVKLNNRKKNLPLNNYMPIKYYDGSNEEYSNLVIVDDTSNIERNYINKEYKTLLMSKIKEILNKQQYLVLKMFINGESYATIAKNTQLTVKNVDNMLQAIKKKLRNIKGEL